MTNEINNDHLPHRVIDAQGKELTVMPNKKTAKLTAAFYSQNEPQLTVELVKP